jgi:hypothetical protein
MPKMADMRIETPDRAAATGAPAPWSGRTRRARSMNVVGTAHQHEKQHE